MAARELAYMLGKMFNEENQNKGIVHDLAVNWCVFKCQENGAIKDYKRSLLTINGPINEDVFFDISLLQDTGIIEVKGRYVKGNGIDWQMFIKRIEKDGSKEELEKIKTSVNDLKAEVEDFKDGEKLLKGWMGLMKRK
ncbi:MAG: hypothetical protein CVT88_01905 [Candidatus Altiarchaeales archaeon HGW-Altiarchaeales-1]|nr:MAG: hypothetical protein CVT88_01905 [Candidatus Altiarchaeales archaeon HGW-Altiarchaeales-1]